MAGRELTVKRVIHASEDAVWAVVTDVAHASETLRGVSRVEVLEGPEYAVGTRAAPTRRPRGARHGRSAARGVARAGQLR